MPSIDYFLPSISFPGLVVGPNPPKPVSAQLVVVPSVPCVAAVPGYQIRFPGASVQVTNSMRSLKDGCDVIGDKLMLIVQAVMTAMKPIFDLIDLVQKVINCITAIPDAIKNADPGPVLQCIPGLAEKLAEILAYLFPPIAVPPFIADVVCVVKTIIDCMIEQVQALLALESKVQLLETKIQTIGDAISNEGKALLKDAAANGRLCQKSLMDNLGTSAKPLTPLISLLNSFAALVPNFPAIPTLSSLSGLPLNDMQQQLTQFQGILGAIPDTCVLPAT